MKLKIEYNFEVVTSVAYLIIEKEEVREDIMTFLKDPAKIKLPSWQKERIRQYLQTLGLYNADFNLTTDGEYVKETGKIWIKEEGKFNVWRIHEGFIGVINLEYDKPRDWKGNNIPNGVELRNELLNELREKYNFTIDDKGNLCRIKIQQPTYHEFYTTRDKRTGTVKLTLEWDSINDASGRFFFSSKEDIGITFPSELEIDEYFNTSNDKYSKYLNPKYYIRKICHSPKYKYDEILNVVKISFEQAIKNLSPEEMSNFKQNQLNGTLELDDGLQCKYLVHDIPIIPAHKQDAIDWFHWLIIQSVKKDYIFTESQWNDLLLKTINAEGLKQYKENLRKYSRKEFLDVILHNISKFVNITHKNEDYIRWKLLYNLMAPVDMLLNISGTPKPYMNNELKYIILFKYQEKLRMKDVVKKLIERVNLSDKSIKLVIYYDKYALKDLKKRRLVNSLFSALRKELAGTVSKETKFFVIAGSNNDERYYSHSKDKDIDLAYYIQIITDLKYIFGERKPDHNRRLIMVDSVGMVYMYEFPNSIDFLNPPVPSQDNIDEETILITTEQNTVTLVVKDVNTLEEHWLNFIKKNLKIKQ